MSFGISFDVKAFFTVIVGVILLTPQPGLRGQETVPIPVPITESEKKGGIRPKKLIGKIIPGGKRRQSKKEAESADGNNDGAVVIPATSNPSTTVAPPPNVPAAAPEPTSNPVVAVPGPAVPVAVPVDATEAKPGLLGRMGNLLPGKGTDQASEVDPVEPETGSEKGLLYRLKARRQSKPGEMAGESGVGSGPPVPAVTPSEEVGPVVATESSEPRPRPVKTLTIPVSPGAAVPEAATEEVPTRVREEPSEPMAASSPPEPELVVEPAVETITAPMVVDEEKEEMPAPVETLSKPQSVAGGEVLPGNDSSSPMTSDEKGTEDGVVGFAASLPDERESSDDSRLAAAEAAVQRMPATVLTPAKERGSKSGRASGPSSAIGEAPRASNGLVPLPPLKKVSPEEGASRLVFSAESGKEGEPVSETAQFVTIRDGVKGVLTGIRGTRQSAVPGTVFRFLQLEEDVIRVQSADGIEGRIEAWQLRDATFDEAVEFLKQGS